MTVAAALRAWLVGRRPLWGVDYDGTLVSLDADPEKVKLSARAIAALERLAPRGECAVISGRGLDDLKKHVPLSGFHLIANHGCQLLRRDGTLWQWTSPDWTAWRQAHLPAIEQLVATHGGWIEDKHYSLAIHWNSRAPSGRAPVKDDASWWRAPGVVALGGMTKQGARLIGGTLCWNLVPEGAPHKGDTAARLCRETGCDGIVYFGDEPTDENVFRLTEFPVFGVKVGEAPTAAGWRLGGPDDVIETLEQVLA